MAPTRKLPFQEKTRSTPLCLLDGVRRSRVHGKPGTGKASANYTFSRDCSDNRMVQAQRLYALDDKSSRWCRDRSTRSPDSNPATALPFPSQFAWPSPVEPSGQIYPLRFVEYPLLHDSVNANSPWVPKLGFFKNSHFNVAYYNSPNFNPEVYRPEASFGFARKAKIPAPSGTSTIKERDTQKLSDPFAPPTERGTSLSSSLNSAPGSPRESRVVDLDTVMGPINSPRKAKFHGFHDSESGVNNSEDASFWCPSPPPSNAVAVPSNGTRHANNIQPSGGDAALLVSVNMATTLETEGYAKHE